MSPLPSGIATTKNCAVSALAYAQCSAQPWMLEGFASPFAHEPILLDKIRCDAYHEAIQRT